MRIEEITDQTLDEDWKKTARNAAAYGALSVAGSMGLTHAINHFTGNTTQAVSKDAPIDVEYEYGPDDIEDEANADNAPVLRPNASPEEIKMANDAIAKARAGHGHAKKSGHHGSHMTALQKDIYVMALTMWGEARNQGTRGMAAVGHVIKNRADSDHPHMFGNGIIGVALKHKQFSCWNKDDPNLDKMRHIHDLPRDSPEWQRWEEAKKIAKGIMTGRARDFTNKATFYHTQQINPYWKNDVKKVAAYGQHVFYALKHDLNRDG